MLGTVDIGSRRTITAGLANFPVSVIAFAFSNNRIGWAFDHHADETLFTDSAGTTPAVLEDPIGLQLDKSGNGFHRFQDVSADRPILSARYNKLVGTETLATQSVTTRAQDYQLRFSGAGSVTLSGTATGTFNAGTHTITATAGTLTLTVSGSVTQADLLPAKESSLPYQQVVTATDYDGDKSKFPRYLSCNGTNQWMKTATLDFTSSDKIAVFAGVKKLSDSVGMVLEFSDNWAAGPGGGKFSLQAGTDSGFYYFSGARGSASASLSQGAGWTVADVAPDIAVIRVNHDISATLSTMHRNGVRGSDGTGNKGTGNFSSQPLNFFRRSSSTSLYFNGREYSSIGRLGPITDAEINAIGKYVASRVPGVTV